METISMAQFFSLPEVVAAQDVQKANPFGSPAHRQAFDALVSLAARYGVEVWIGDYE